MFQLSGSYFEPESLTLSWVGELPTADPPVQGLAAALSSLNLPSGPDF